MLMRGRKNILKDGLITVQPFKLFQHLAPPSVPNSNVNSLDISRFFSQGSGIGEPSLYHALVVIFLEFFAWGLLTTPMITVRKTSTSALWQAELEINFNLLVIFRC